MVKKPRILVVDDDEWILYGAKASLQANYDVVTAQDGWEGLSEASRVTPDAIVTDVVMPKMDGWQFVRQLRSMSRFALVPVIFLTARSAAADRINGFQLGADDYLAKPLNVLDLPNRIRQALERKSELEAELQSDAAPRSAGAGRFQGTLDRVGIASLLSILDTGRRSGILRLVCPLADLEMLLYLVKGKVHRAEIEGQRKLVNAGELHDLFKWMQGTFEFTAMNLRLRDELQVSTSALLLQGARQGLLTPEVA